MKTNRETFRKIASLDCEFEITRDGRFIRNIKSKKYCEIKLDKDGYNITYIKGWGSRRVARLVAEAWIGPCPEGYEVDHFDRNRRNDDFSNLRWVTHQVNSQNRDHSHMAEACVKRLGNKVAIDGNVFDSFTKAGEFLEAETGISKNTFRHYFKKRRKYIHGHIISYNVAETVC